MEKGKTCAAKEVPYNARLLVSLAQCVLGRLELYTQGETAKDYCAQLLEHKRLVL
jgi:hypothetical protein